VTFAFSDIEGSTLRWDRDRSAMQDAVRRHDGVMRATTAEHGGFVFKTVGDAFCMAFARPEDGVAAMLAAQRALAMQDFSAVDGVRVRMALHTGTADEREGDYFGPAVNRVARLLAIGHGGQVLVSGATADLVLADLPPQASLRDLGQHRLKDLSRPEQVYQLLAPGLNAEFPSLRSLDALPNNLPGTLTSFVGREREIAEITALIDKHRLVTLVGSGGIGKTRVSLQVAANVLDGSGDGVWFIELAPLSGGEYIPSTVAQALNLSLPAEGDPVENLARVLQSKHALLVFDNCEHLVEPAAYAIAAIVRRCPKIKVLASSRQALGLVGEVTYRMPSLELPSEAVAARLTADETARYAATALFVERACAVDNRFAPSDENAPIIADICRRLDGIPLAIELAASRVRILSPRQLREHLNERFRVLTGGSRDVLPRQQTLRATLDWSHDLLDERERRLFRRLGIFVNGFTLQSAVVVGGEDEITALDVLDVLASLVDKSLVLAEPDGDALRYRLLESARAYAGEKLEAADERERCAKLHARHLRDLFDAARDRWQKTGREAELENPLTTELEDVRAALDWALRSGDATLGAALIAAIGRTWEWIGLECEGLARNESFTRALEGREPRLVAELQTNVARFTGNLRRSLLSFEIANQAVERARACGDLSALAEALLAYAMAALRVNRPDDAEAALSQVETNPQLTAQRRLHVQQIRAFLDEGSGQPARAAPRFEALVKAHRALGNTAELRNTLNLAEVLHHLGETQRAIAIVREALPRFRADRNRGTLTGVLQNFAGYLLKTDEVLEACAIAHEAIRVATSYDREFDVVMSVEPLALALALRGDLSRAATLEGYADNAMRDVGFQREFTETTTYDRLMSLLCEKLAPDDLACLLADGAALSRETAVALALEEP
jgi:predicted ATPase/class 3 adenylate cyclase